MKHGVHRVWSDRYFILNKRAPAPTSQSCYVLDYHLTAPPPGEKHPEKPRGTYMLGRGVLLMEVEEVPMVSKMFGSDKNEGDYKPGQTRWQSSKPANDKKMSVIMSYNTLDQEKRRKLR